MGTLTKRPRAALTAGGLTPEGIVPMQDHLTNEVYWVAGFFEGEGTIVSSRGQLRMAAGQNYREPLERVQAVLGGGICKQKYRDYYMWHLGKRADVEAAISLLGPLLSERRREQIAAAIVKRDEYRGSAKHKEDQARIAARVRERYANDPEFRARRKAQQRKWAERNPEYRKKWRERQR